MMGMTSYEIVKRAITFNNPERVALKYANVGEGDVVRIYLQTPRALRKDPEEQVDMKVKVVPTPGAYDEWGVLWENMEGDGLGLGQPLKGPIHTWDDYKTYTMPDPYAIGRFDGLEEVLREAEKEQKWVQLNSQYLIFERLHFLRGFENTLMDMYTEREMFELLCDDLLNYQLGIVRQAAKLGKGRIHAIDFSDDWGTQNALMISPDLWREIFKPRYKVLVDEMHKHGMYVDFHSCGRINDILNDFVEIGVDMLNIHQPNLIGFETLEKYAGKIAFDISIDIQKTLPTGDKTLIEKEVMDIMHRVGTKKGGIVAAEYKFLKAINVTVESAKYGYACFVKHGQYELSR
ncbi:hypothetical protein HZI73_08100 [Vallitalea pronyensis]|uniref:Uroporphyrinogen decarboxylase (URO-D) domain-containing protein n=1 Tax=Vallitalea pronyensis TaxID=1348613 RepID=A0A8J8MIV1_9FIRM|nr:uroporphyrinogen decarboxylase family protein [Vallitalea pronyensis]QUI22261.1 hypothetical protein HZI73_08100 [Vallitalea pronyensis]